MKKLSLVLALSLVALAAVAQPAPRGGQDGDAAPTRDPHMVSPTPSGNTALPDAPMLPYRFTPHTPLPEGMATTLVSAVALTPEGHTIFLTRNPAAMLIEFDKNDKFLRTFAPNIAIGPHGVRVDSHGNIWVTDSFLNVVWKLNPKGEPIFELGERGANKKWDDSKWNGAFSQPLDVAFDKNDNFYVIQGHGGTSNPLACVFCMTYAKAKADPVQGSDPRIFKFDKNGNYLKSLALPHPDGTYPTDHSVIVTQKGEVWVADRQILTIKVFDTDLKPLREIKEPYLVSGLFQDAKGTIWMTAGMDGHLMKLDADGKIVGWLGETGRPARGAPAGTANAGRGDPNSPLIGEAHFLAVTPDENTIYVADSSSGKMLEWKRN